MYDCETCIGRGSCGQGIRECKENHRVWRDKGLTPHTSRTSQLESEIKILKAECNRLVRENRRLKGSLEHAHEQCRNDFGENEAAVGPDNWG